MTTVMLVHGAWHRPSTWTRLQPELHALGYATRTPALPSAGERPTAGMHDDAAVLAAELAAYLPDRGQSLCTLHGLPDPDDTSGLFPLIDQPRTSLYGDLPDAEAEQEMSRLVNQTRRSFTEKADTAGWHDIPATYIVTERDQAVPPALQERMAARAAEIRRLTSGHCPFLSQPHRLAALVDGIVRSAAG
ncbi:alpha/beta fold hydrolase [Nonomuraea sp. NPDC049655]|uniref:alpha/beta fold hydrolase n=1 Tax=Nonomuraea sp. NPDC049655 TaxID=3364355 RepID=UPI00379710BF